MKTSFRIREMKHCQAKTEFSCYIVMGDYYVEN